MPSKDKCTDKVAVNYQICKQLKIVCEILVEQTEDEYYKRQFRTQAKVFDRFAKTFKQKGGAI